MKLFKLLRYSFAEQTIYLPYTCFLCHPQILSHCVLVVIANMYPKDFTPEAHVAFDKFLSSVALALAERYR